MADIKKDTQNAIVTQFSNAGVRGSEEGNDAFHEVMSSIKSEGADIDEKWSKEYKDSIDCSNPKGFSQRAHCQGKKKKSENKEATGAASSGQFSAPLFSKESKKTETKEATGASSSGSYVTPAAWAKSTSKKDWRGKSKTQIPGGKFVTIKKKCKTFPYCNQGDIKALKLYENETMKKVINKISKEHNISENVIKSIIQYELENKLNK